MVSAAGFRGKTRLIGMVIFYILTGETVCVSRDGRRLITVPKVPTRADNMRMYVHT